MRHPDDQSVSKTDQVGPERETCTYPKSDSPSSWGHIITRMRQLRYVKNSLAENIRLIPYGLVQEVLTTRSIVFSCIYVDTHVVKTQINDEPVLREQII